MIIHQPNDKLFKKSMADVRVAQEFFETNLPATILECVDLSSLSLEKHSFIDEHYKSTEADLVYSVKLDDSTAYFYLLCEHQSKVDRDMAFRFLVYIIRLMELHLQRYPGNPLPIVYPILVYSGEQKWDAPLEIFELFGNQASLAREILFKPYKLIDLQRVPDEELHKQTWSGLFQYALKCRHLSEYRLFLETLFPWLKELSDLNARDYVTTVLSYTMDGMEVGDVKLFLEKSQELPEKLRGEVMTIAQQLEQRGEATMLLNMIKLKFKQVPSALEDRVKKMSANDLLAFSEQVLTKDSLEEL
jgi:predicted transposase/invertase (TIGR01784 family)